jgi:hypothetical protein
MGTNEGPVIADVVPSSHSRASAMDRTRQNAQAGRHRIFFVSGLDLG